MVNVAIQNAAPMVIDLGTRDLSTRVVPSSFPNIPQHLPKVYIFAEKGPIGPNYVDLDVIDLTTLYGSETFKVDGKYYTHQTPLLEIVAKNANNCVVHRLIPDDAKDKANIALYLDVLPTQVPIYKKYTDGSLQLDNNGNPVPELDSNGDPITVTGYKVKWVVDHQSVDVGLYEPGRLTIRQGTQTDGTNQSLQYPILEFFAKFQGEYANKLAIRLYPATQKDLFAPFPSKLLTDAKTYPYYFELHKLDNPNTGKMKNIFNKLGSKYSKFILKENGRDPVSEAVVDITKVLTDEYINADDSLDIGLGGVYFYNDNLDTLSQMFYDAEKVVADPYRDPEVNTTENNIYAINVISFTSSNGSPYQAIKLVDDTDSVRLTKNTNIFLKGSSDGTMTEKLLDQLVAEDVRRYSDHLDEYNDLVLHPESIIYDTGFTLSTKKELFNFISRRKDTFVVLSTYSHDAAATLLSDQYSIAIALKTTAELYPESAYFGTPVMRAVIIGGSGRLINSNYVKRAPLTYELAHKASRYMGAANGRWKPGYRFDKAPLSVVELIKDIDVTWVPASYRNALWSTGLNFVLNYSIKQQFFPALQTVYDNDTSVLNSFFTAVAISYLNKIAHAAWREFSGSISYTNAQLIERVNNFVYQNTKDKFDGLYVIEPNTYITEYDALRGYSWNLAIKIYANNMKTVMTTYVEAYRMEDLVATP